MAINWRGCGATRREVSFTTAISRPLQEVIGRYNHCLQLGLTEQEKIECLKWV